MTNKQKPIYESFSISLMDNNWDTNADKNGKLLPNKKLTPIMLENHPCEYARQIYELGFKLCKWLNNNNDHLKHIKPKIQYKKILL